MSKTPEQIFEHELREAAHDLIEGRITARGFEERCKSAWRKHNGQEPVGRKLVVGMAGNRVVVGHIEAA